MTRRAALVLAALALASAACGPRRPTTPPVPTTLLVTGVPFVAQTARDCGPAALAMVLGFFGEPASLEDLTTRLYHPGAEGTFTLDLLLEAKRRGLEARQVKGTLATLEATLAEGRPLLVFLDVGRLAWSPRWHFAVAIGLSPEDVLLHSGDRAATAVPVDRFLRAWSRTDYWALDVRRRG